MAGFDDLNGFERYDFQDWIKFSSLEDVPIYILSQWHHDSQYGDEVSFVFAIYSEKVNGNVALYASSTNVKLLIHKLDKAKEQNLLPRWGKFVKEPSEKAQSGFFWQLTDAEHSVDTSIKTAVRNYLAKQKNQELPNDLPF